MASFPMGKWDPPNISGALRQALGGHAGKHGVFLDGRGGAECWDDRLSSSELDRMVDSKKTQMAMDQYLWKYHF